MGQNTKVSKEQNRQGGDKQKEGNQKMKPNSDDEKKNPVVRHTHCHTVDISLPMIHRYGDRVHFYFDGASFCFDEADWNGFRDTVVGVGEEFKEILTCEELGVEELEEM